MGNLKYWRFTHSALDIQKHFYGVLLGGYDCNEVGICLIGDAILGWFNKRQTGHLLPAAGH